MQTNEIIKELLELKLINHNDSSTIEAAIAKLEQLQREVNTLNKSRYREGGIL